MEQEKPKKKFAYMFTGGDFVACYQEAIELAKKRGKKPGDDIGQEMLEIAKKKGINVQCLGSTKKDIDLLTGDLREKGLKILNMNEIERQKKLKDK